MNTEELSQEQAAERPQFDAHEFDGLRDAFEKDAETVFAKVDQYIRENPWLCIGIAAAVGFAVACTAQKTSSRKCERAA